MTPDEEKNTKLLVRWFDEVWNKQRADAIDELFAPDGVAYGLGPEDAAIQGPAAFKEFHKTFCGAFPDIHMKVEDVIAQDDRTAVRLTVTGTHRGDQLGVPATGKTVRFTGMTFTRWRDGQIVEGWNNVDIAGAMKQIGAE